jgi:formate hydrogenlyase subunit 3/multisubunit Na+/H+ antiporter MnhD subunit
LGVNRKIEKEISEGMILEKNFVNQYLIFTFALPFLATLIYSLKDKEIRNWEFYLFLFLLLFSSLIIILANNLLLIYIFFEISTLASWRLVLLKRENEKAGSYLLYLNFSGAVLMLIGILLLLLENNFEKITYETFNLVNISKISLIAGILISCGILAKSAIIPFYNWLPPVYTVSPIPVVALLAGIGENLGLILFYKIFLSGIIMENSFYNFISLLAIFSSLIAGGIAYFEKEIRRILAYSTISQLSFILFGFALKEEKAIIGSLILILAHALAKPGLFYKLKAPENNVSNFGYSLLSLSLIGIPPFLGFSGKLLIILGGLQRNLFLGILAIFSSIFTLFYTLKFYPLLKKEKGENVISTSIVYIFGLLLLAFGIIALIYFWGIIL